MIYRIDHYYNKNHDKQCLLVDMNVNVDLLIKILASIQFAFEEIVDESISVSSEDMLSILIEFYCAVNVKEKYSKYLTFTNTDNENWEIVKEYVLDNGTLKITQVDMYLSRESCCGNNYSKIMNEVLPAEEKFTKRIKELGCNYTFQ